MATRIILTRSGATDYDDQHRIAGTLDVPLNCRGRAEAADLARDLRKEPVEAVYAAAGEASAQTAAILGERLGAKVKVLDDLRNQDFGLWQGLSLEELKQRHPKLVKLWEDSPCSVCPPNGEMPEAALE